MKIKKNELGIAHITVAVAIVVIAIVGLVGWRICNNKAIQNIDKSSSVISKYCNDDRSTSNVSGKDVNESKKAITSTGFSEGFVNKNFWPVKVEDYSVQNDSIEYITWHYCINGYSGVINIEKNNSTGLYKLLLSNSKFSDFSSTISIAESLKRMQACGGVIEEEYTETNNLKGDTTLQIQLGSDSTDYYQAPPDSKFKSIPLLVSESKKYPVTQFGGSQVYVSLIDGDCYTSAYVGPV